MHETEQRRDHDRGLTVGVTRSAQDSGMAKLTPLHREVVQGMPQPARAGGACAVRHPASGRRHAIPFAPVSRDGLYAGGHIHARRWTGGSPVAIEAGQAFVEPAGISMTGFNKGDVPARMALFYVCEPDAPFADPAGATA